MAGAAGDPAPPSAEEQREPLTEGKRAMQRETGAGGWDRYRCADGGELREKVFEGGARVVAGYNPQTGRGRAEARTEHGRVIAARRVCSREELPEKAELLSRLVDPEIVRSGAAVVMPTLHSHA